MTLAAVGVLTWMIFWMRRQGARIRSELQDKVDTALVAGGLALAGLAFFAVLREGIETALFLFAAAKGTAVEGTEVAPATQVTGAVLGLLLAVILGVLLYRGGIRMNLRSFFRVTGLILIVVAAGLFAYSLHELQEAGWLPFLEGHAFDISSSLPDDTGAGAILRGLVGLQRRSDVDRGGGLARIPRGHRWVLPPHAKVPGTKSRPEHETSDRTSTHCRDRGAALDPVAAGRVRVTLLANPLPARIRSGPATQGVSSTRPRVDIPQPPIYSPPRFSTGREPRSVPTDRGGGPGRPSVTGRVTEKGRSRMGKARAPRIGGRGPSRSDYRTAFRNCGSRVSACR